MDISIPSIPHEVERAYQLFRLHASQWANITVRWIDGASLHLQNPWAAGASVFVMNLIFFEVALRVCRSFHRIINRDTPYELIPECDRNAAALGLGTLFVATVGLANWAFCKMLRLPLSNWNVAAISLPTGFFYLIWKSYA